MNEVKMSLYEIRINFGDDIADQCKKMRHGEVKEFSTATYEGIVVRCEKIFVTTNYYVCGELILEEALEMEEDYGIDMGM